MKKKILIYAHYYAPDVASTGQLLQDMAEGMKDEFDVTVICAVPSYSGTIDAKYRQKKVYKESINGIEVLRVSVPEFTKNSKISRIKNVAAYYFNARRVTKELDRQDYVFAISQPPILGGMLGVIGKKRFEAKMIYCIQDFNPEQAEAIGYIGFKPLVHIAKWLDNRSCKKSDLVITVGRDLIETLKDRFYKKIVPNHILINNWINERDIYPLSSDDESVIQFKEKYNLKDKFVIMYSGNIGLYYDLEGLIKVIGKFKNAKTKDGRDVVFAFVGAGTALDELVKYKDNNKLDNVEFIPYQPKDKLIYSLNAADVHWCVNARGIKGVSCPSKFYGILGVAKPVIGVLEKGSEVEMLIDEIGCGMVSEPGDYKMVEKSIKWFIDNADSEELKVMGKRGHEYMLSNLTKDISMKKYIEAIKSI